MPQSRHMYGDAADLRNESRTEEEWKAMYGAALRAHASFREPRDGPCKLNCVHADWRPHFLLSGSSRATPSNDANQSSRVQQVEKDLAGLQSSSWETRKDAFYHLVGLDVLSQDSVSVAVAKLFEDVPQETDVIQLSLIDLLTQEDLRTQEATRAYGNSGITLSEAY